MKARYSDNFVDSLEEASPLIQKAFYKQLHFLLENLRHPSLHAKKYDETGNIWQARVTGNWRFYFTIKNNIYYLLEIKSHPK